MQSIEDDVRKLGVHTFPIPLGLKRNEADPLASKCIRCDTCDGYPCIVHAKSDADINCIRQIMHLPNVTLMTNSRVTRFLPIAPAPLLPRSRSSTPVPVSLTALARPAETYGPPASKNGSTAIYTAGLFSPYAPAPSTPR